MILHFAPYFYFIKLVGLGNKEHYGGISIHGRHFVIIKQKTLTQFSSPKKTMVLYFYPLSCKITPWNFKNNQESRLRLGILFVLLFSDFRAASQRKRKKIISKMMEFIHQPNGLSRESTKPPGEGGRKVWPWN